MLTPVGIASNLVVRVIPGSATERRGRDYILLTDGELSLSGISISTV
jgi:hypothetical protein